MGTLYQVQSGTRESSGKTSLGFWGDFIWKFILLEVDSCAWAFIFSMQMLILYKTRHKSDSLLTAIIPVQTVSEEQVWTNSFWKKG